MKKFFLLFAVCVFADCARSNSVSEQKSADQARIVSAPDSVSSPLPVKSGVEGKKEGKTVEIKEKMFIAQTNDVYLNAEDYLGRTIKLEGLFKSERYEEKPICFVVRYAPGCCGNDGSAGFEVAWDAQEAETYPAEDDWVEAVGTLKTYETDGFPYVYIALSSLKVLDKRGEEFVTQ
jgi:uncharacterized membrane protein YcgQ (UPF0703/DUF1980 family)